MCVFKEIANGSEERRTEKKPTGGTFADPD
jgi:hypothetical protein